MKLRFIFKPLKPELDFLRKRLFQFWFQRKRTEGHKSNFTFIVLLVFNSTVHTHKQAKKLSNKHHKIKDKNKIFIAVIIEYNTVQNIYTIDRQRAS